VTGSTRAHVHRGPRLVLAAILVGLAGLWVYALSGDLDPTFGTDGIVRTDIATVIGGFEPAYDDSRAVLVQSDGKVIVVGFTSMSFLVDGIKVTVARYSSDGVIDSTYGQNGVAVTDVSAASISDSPRAATMQADGKCIVVGSLQFGTIPGGTIGGFLLRYNTDGSLDASFGNDGRVVIDWPVQGVALQPDDGRIVVTGSTGVPSGSGFIARYNPNGTLDEGFPNGVLAGLWTTALAIQPDHRIIAVGNVWHAVSGVWLSDIGLVRLLPDGTLDDTFGAGGTVMTDLSPSDHARTVGLQPDGKILVGLITRTGGGYDFSLMRYTTAGALDPTFGSDGKVITDIAGGNDWLNAVALEPDGHIVAVGGTKVALGGIPVDPSNLNWIALARYDSTGNLDPDFGTHGLVTTLLPGSSQGATSVALQSRGKVLVGSGGYGPPSDSVLARYDTGALAQDVTPPLLTLPNNMTADATGPLGATVSYLVSVTDDTDPTPVYECSPASGATFPIGTTAVLCSATDASGNTATGSFEVHVRGASEQTQNVVALVQTLDVKQAITSSLDAKLQNIQAALAAATAGDRPSACNMLNAFVNEVEAQTGKTLTTAQAADLIAAARRVQAVLGC